MSDFSEQEVVVVVVVVVFIDVFYVHWVDL